MYIVFVFAVKKFKTKKATIFIDHLTTNSSHTLWFLRCMPNTQSHTYFTNNNLKVKSYKLLHRRRLNKPLEFRRVFLSPALNVAVGVVSYLPFSKLRLNNLPQNNFQIENQNQNENENPNSFSSSPLYVKSLSFSGLRVLISSVHDLC